MNIFSYKMPSKTKANKALSLGSIFAPGENDGSIYEVSIRPNLEFGFGLKLGCVMKGGKRVTIIHSLPKHPNRGSHLLSAEALGKLGLMDQLLAVNGVDVQDEAFQIICGHIRLLGMGLKTRPNEFLTLRFKRHEHPAPPAAPAVAAAANTINKQQPQHSSVPFHVSKRASLQSIIMTRKRRDSLNLYRDRRRHNLHRKSLRSLHVKALPKDSPPALPMDFLRRESSHRRTLHSLRTSCHKEPLPKDSLHSQSSQCSRRSINKRSFHKKVGRDREPIGSIASIFDEPLLPSFVKTNHTASSQHDDNLYLGRRKKRNKSCIKHQQTKMRS